jgi:hypothetical protein
LVEEFVMHALEQLLALALLAFVGSFTRDPTT